MTTEAGRDIRFAIHHFCTVSFGPESWPIHNKPGNWLFGGATVDGETWIGFATKDMMDQFTAKFPDLMVKE
jgi:hypothetical protein